MWILLGARSARTALVALADVDVVVRAIDHLTAQVDERLTQASQRFIRNLVAHGSQAGLEALIDASGGKTPEAILAQLRSLPVGALTKRGRVGETYGSGRMHLLVRLVAEQLSPDETLTAAAELASMHPELVGERTTELRSLLATVAARDRLIKEVAGDPRQTVGADEVADSVLRQARIAGEAMASIWEYPMLESRAAAVALGAKPGNREKVRTYRGRSWLLGLPRGRGYVYPWFQFDPESLELFSEVRSVNESLEAAKDPWGVASWWVTVNDRLGCRPVELVGTERASEVVHAAEALVEPVG